MRSSRGDVIVTLCDADTAAGDAGNKSHPFVTQDRRVLPFFFHFIRETQQNTQG